MALSGGAAGIRALAFDVFGTVVDWRGSIVRELAEFADRHGLEGDWEAFADAWRAGYAPAMDRVRRGELPWQNIDRLHRGILDDLLAARGFVHLDDDARDHLNRAWHRLAPWPDAREGLLRLKAHYTITTLSNGSFSLLTGLSKRAGLAWDCIISAELFRHYKPDPETYRGAAALLDLPQAALMLVAAHPDDLRAARAQGLRTAYLQRSLEFGAGKPPLAVAAGEFDVVASDCLDLADQLAAPPVARESL